MSSERIGVRLLGAFPRIARVCWSPERGPTGAALHRRPAGADEPRRVDVEPPVFGDGNELRKSLRM